MPLLVSPVREASGGVLGFLRPVREARKGTGGKDSSAERHTPEGARWITVHPNGDDGHGQPVLISGSGQVLGGMGGKFNGQHIGDVAGWKQAGTAKPGGYGASGTHEGYNQHLATYGGAKAIADVTVHGTPVRHAGGTFSVHVAGGKGIEKTLNQHGQGQTSGGAFLEKHPDGGAIYHGGAHAPDTWHEFAKHMSEDLLTHSAEHEHRRMMGRPDKTPYKDEHEAEATATRKAAMKQVRDYIRAEGGIKAGRTRTVGQELQGTTARTGDEYRHQLPAWAKNQNGKHTTDQMARLVGDTFPHLGIETEDDLREYLMGHERQRKADAAAEARERAAKSSMAQGPPVAQPKTDEELKADFAARMTARNEEKAKAKAAADATEAAKSPEQREQERQAVATATMQAHREGITKSPGLHMQITLTPHSHLAETQAGRDELRRKAQEVLAGPATGGDRAHARALVERLDNLEQSVAKSSHAGPDPQLLGDHSEALRAIGNAHPILRPASKPTEKAADPPTRAEQYAEKTKGEYEQFLAKTAAAREEIARHRPTWDTAPRGEEGDYQNGHLRFNRESWQTFAVDHPASIAEYNRLHAEGKRDDPYDPRVHHVIQPLTGSSGDHPVAAPVLAPKSAVAAQSKYIKRGSYSPEQQAAVDHLNAQKAKPKAADDVPLFADLAVKDRPKPTEKETKRREGGLFAGIRESRVAVRECAGGAIL